MSDGPESVEEMAQTAARQAWTVLPPSTKAILEQRLNGPARTTEAQGADTFSHRAGYGEARYGGKSLADWLLARGGASLSWDEALALAREVVSLRERLVSCTEAASWTAADRATVERARLCEEHRVRVTYSAESGKWMAWDETGFAAFGATRAEAEDGVLARARALVAEPLTPDAERAP